MPCLLSEFQDILEPRRTEFSNFMWVSRQLSTTVPYKHSVKIGPQELKLEVLRSARVQQIIAKLSSEEQRLASPKELQDKIRAILDEIGYNRKLKVIRWLGLVLAKILTRVCHGIHVHEESIVRLKSSMGKAPVIYLPSHRSYADFILMSYICFHYDVEIPAIAAGMDFHGMLGMGNVLRDTGAFFMRRTYNDDSLYWDTFREYVYQLVAKADLGIEFFIEGTRSRTGKSLPPKFGLLTMVLKAFFSGDVPDVLFVPINISYDRVMEERLFAFELLGVPKPKESTSAFFKSLKLINEKYGDVYVRFGRAIPARRFFEERSVRQVMAERERQVISTLAQEIVNTQQKLCVITTFNMIAVVYMNNIMSAGAFVTLESLGEEVVGLRGVLEAFGATTNYTCEEDIFRALRVHENLLQVGQRRQEILLVKNNITLDSFDAAKLKGHALSEKTMSEAIPLVMLQLYVNPTLHYFINPALVMLVLKQHHDYTIIEKEQLCKEYLFLRSLFSKEFVLFPNREKTDFEDSLRQLQRLEVVELQESSNSVALHQNRKLQALLCNLAEPFIFTYYVLCQVLKKLTVSECGEKSILEMSQYHIETLMAKTVAFIHPYSLNLDSVSNCLLRLVELKAVERLRMNESIVYRVNYEATAAIAAQLYGYLKAIVCVELLEVLDSAAQFPSKM